MKLSCSDGFIPVPLAILFVCGTNILTYHLYRCLAVSDPSPVNGGLINPTLLLPDASDTKFLMADRHSYGFFTDIDNDEWNIYYRAPAIRAPHYWNTSMPNDGQDQVAWWIYNNWDPYFVCPHAQKVGGLGDGPKWTCDPERIVHHQRQANRPSHHRCLIYSVGSNGNYLFEDAIHAITKHQNNGIPCEIHIFDPGDYNRPGMEEKLMYFHQWGLSSEDGKYQIQRRRGDGEYVTFDEIRTRLGHKGRTIDILKIDCEGCEWYDRRERVTSLCLIAL